MTTSALKAFSYSSLKQFENCPLQFYNLRVAKTVKDVQGEAAAWGDRVHKNIEDFISTGMPMPASTRSFQGIVEAVMKGMKEDITLEVEQQRAITENFTETGWWDKDVWFRAKLDILARGSTRATILDWKTGKRRPDWDQLKMFAMMVMTLYPDINEVRSGFVWLKDTAIDSITYERDQLPQLVELLLAKVDRVKQAEKHDVWPARPSGLCRFCACRHICDYAQ